MRKIISLFGLIVLSVAALWGVMNFAFSSESGGLLNRVSKLNVESTKDNEDRLSYINGLDAHRPTISLNISKIDVNTDVDLVTKFNISANGGGNTLPFTIKVTNSSGDEILGEGTVYSFNTRGMYNMEITSKNVVEGIELETIKTYGFIVD